MKCKCTKCNKVTEFVKKSMYLKAGDNGYCTSDSWTCSLCGFTPLFVKPMEGKDA